MEYYFQWANNLIVTYYFCKKLLRVSISFCYFVFLVLSHPVTRGLFLALCSEGTSGSAQRTLCGVRDWTRVTDTARRVTHFLHYLCDTKTEHFNDTLDLQSHGTVNNKSSFGPSWCMWTPWDFCLPSLQWHFRFGMVMPISGRRTNKASGSWLTCPSSKGF